jgi:ABC-2 type transport system ATP-binding protein
MDAIRCIGLKKNYGDFSLNLEEFVVPQGSIVGLIGENGAGKSTTIRLLLSLTSADKGSIELFGEAVDRCTVRHKDLIGFVMEDAWPSAYLNAIQTGKVMEKVYTRWDAICYDELLDRLSIPKEKLFKQFSHGMKMKLVLAIALSHHAKLLILDEPTSSLDPMTRDEILSILMEFTREEDHTVLISSHIISDLEKISDYITYIHQGRIILNSEKDQLEQDYVLASCTHQQSYDLEPSVVLGRKDTPYGVKVLMKREHVPDYMQRQLFNLEEMMILLAKGGDIQ